MLRCRVCFVCVFVFNDSPIGCMIRMLCLVATHSATFRTSDVSPCSRKSVADSCNSLARYRWSLVGDRPRASDHAVGSVCAQRIVWLVFHLHQQQVCCSLIGILWLTELFVNHLVLVLVPFLNILCVFLWHANGDARRCTGRARDLSSVDFEIATVIDHTFFCLWHECMIVKVARSVLGQCA